MPIHWKQMNFWTCNLFKLRCEGTENQVRPIVHDEVASLIVSQQWETWDQMVSLMNSTKLVRKH